MMSQNMGSHLCLRPARSTSKDSQKVADVEITDDVAFITYTMEGANSWIGQRNG